jgi:hypothetical protein
MRIRTTEPRALALALGVALASPAHATGYPVFDFAVYTTLVEMQTQLLKFQQAVAGSFSNLINAIDASNGKIIDAIGQQGEATIQAANQRESDKQTVDSVRRYQMAPNPCATGGASATADSVIRNARMGAFKSRAQAFRAAGKGGGNTPADALASADNDVKTAFQRAEKLGAVHAETYCDATEASLYSGTKVCNAVGSRPGADTAAHTLFAGSPYGSDSSDTSQTYSTEQQDDAQAYLANLTADYTNNIVPPTKEMMNTKAGERYAAQLRQLRALTDLGNRPAQEEYANHLPYPADELVQALQDSAVSPATAKQIYAKLAAKGGISQLDLLEAETVRRFRNPKWLVAMSSATPEAIAREQLFVSAAQLEMQFAMMRALQTTATVNGQQLNLFARTMLNPHLDAQYQQALRARSQQ